VVQPHVLQFDTTVGDCRRDHQGRRFDAIGDDRVLGPVKPLDAFDLQEGSAQAADLRPHPVQALAEIDHLRLAGRGLDRCDPLGQGSGRHNVAGPGHRAAEGPSQVDPRSAQPPGVGEHIAALDADLRPERAQPLQV
jgi:hypothetical protein